MERTITLPNNVKLRSQTQRRYIVVWTRNGKPHIYRRSDNLNTVRTVWNRYRASPLTDETWFLIDTVTGEAIS